MVIDMLIRTIDELESIINNCKAVPCSEPLEGGNFYKVKSQLFLFPNGTKQFREYLDKKRSSVVVPITDEGNVVMIIQPIALSEEGSLIEFPAGYFELNEIGHEAGIRELSEETGYVPENIIYLGSHYQDPGSIRQKVDSFLAIGCKKLKTQNLDKGEYVKCIEVPYEFVDEIIDRGYLMDANSYIAFNKSNRYLKMIHEDKNVSSIKEYKKSRGRKY